MKFEHGTQVRDYINWEKLIQNGEEITNNEFDELPEPMQWNLLVTHVVGIEDDGRILILENQ